jgi:NitT/TauT family transport system ATP-binding protein
MDEPFGPLDAQTRQTMGNLLLDLWSRDRKAVVFVTHDLDEAIALSDRVIVMSAGPEASIVGDYVVDLPRPRDIGEIRLEDSFHRIHRDIWSSLRVKVQKAYAMGKGKELGAAAAKAQESKTGTGSQP